MSNQSRTTNSVANLKTLTAVTMGHSDRGCIALDAQSTEDKSPLLVSAGMPRPPRPDKTSTILSDNSSIRQQYGSNRLSGKEKLLGAKVGLDIIVPDDASSQRSGPKSCKGTNISTYLTPKIKSSRNSKQIGLSHTMQ